MLHKAVCIFWTAQSEHIQLSTNLSARSNFMPPYTRRLITPLECYPAILSRVQFKKICVLTLPSHEGSKDLALHFLPARFYSLSPRAVCVCAARLRPVCARVRVRGSNLETASINTVMWAARRSHWHNLCCSQMITSQRERGGVREQM